MYDDNRSIRTKVANFVRLSCSSAFLFGSVVPNDGQPSRPFFFRIIGYHPAHGSHVRTDASCIVEIGRTFVIKRFSSRGARRVRERAPVTAPLFTEPEQYLRATFGNEQQRRRTQWFTTSPHNLLNAAIDGETYANG